MQLTGAQALIKSLEQEGVETIFGLPGGAILPVYDPILDSSIRHILVRHEQGAGHMAEGYALATGRPGVAMVTSGPGATNIVTPIGNAHMDSTPLVVITGQVASAAIGTDAFQECDITGITLGITKHNFLIQSAHEIPRVVASAFYLATTGRPGPVLIDFPKDIAQTTMEWWYPTSIEELDLPGYHPELAIDPHDVARAVELIAESERPVLYVGGGTMKSRAHAELLAFAERTRMPVVTTLMARGAFPDSHEQHLGMPGMHGMYPAVTALQKADLVISLGARFDDRVTGQLKSFAANAKIIHVDIDKAEFNKVRRADVTIHTNVATALRALEAASATSQNLDVWWKEIHTWQERYPLVYDEPTEEGPLRPQHVIEAIAKSAKPGTIVTSGVGQHQMWASQFWKFEEPGTWVNSGGAGTMGFGVPAAIGAKVGRPDRTVWCIDGDGCFQMTAQELVTARAEGIPIKVAILNNAYLGMVRQWQEMFYDERYSEVYLSADLPDYVKWAEAMGCVGLRAHNLKEMHEVIARANEINDVPVVIDFRTDSSEKVFSMVAAGASNDDIMVHPVASRGALVSPEPYLGATSHTPVRHHILSVLVENKAGVLARIAGLFARRGFNIYSLAVAPAEGNARFSRVTIVVDAESAPLEQIVGQLDKLINVVAITTLAPSEAIERELLLATLLVDNDNRANVLDIVANAGASIADVNEHSVTVMLAGTPSACDQLEKLLEGFSDVELQANGSRRTP